MDTSSTLPRFLSQHEEIVFCDPYQTISVDDPAQVPAALEQIDAFVGQGYFAAGMIAFEAAPAFDPAFSVHHDNAFPALWFGIFGRMIRRPRVSPHPVATMPQSSWRPLITKSEYLARFEEIKARIAAGDTYQVNYTFPLEGRIAGPVGPLFEGLFQSQPVDFAACLDLGAYQVISLSPELFWRLDGDQLMSKPMKGTRRRRADPQEDARTAAELRASEKERAENVMIVDMVRNDLGRIASIDSVHAEPLFQIEKFRTVWQMTSTVTARTTAGVPEIIATQFPPASVTGAPKVSAMKIINRIEPHPRRAYCGTVGWWAPDRQACFNVAIRTLIRRKSDGLARYHVGSGIVWDADGEQEYAECLAKAAVLGEIDSSAAH